MALLDVFDSDMGRLGLGLLAMGQPSRLSDAERIMGAVQMFDQSRAARAERERQARLDARQAEIDKRNAEMQALNQQLVMRQIQGQEQAQAQAKRAQEARQSYLGAIDQNAGPALPVSLPGAMAAGFNVNEAQALMPPRQAEPKFVTIGNTMVQITPDGRVTPVFQAPKEGAGPDPTKDLLIPGPDGTLVPNIPLIKAKAQIAQAGATNVSYGAPVAGVDASGNPVFFQPSKDGRPPAIVSGVAPPKSDKPLTEAQAKAATFRSQMDSAEKELAGVPIDLTKLGSQVDVQLAGGLTNPAASASAQRARQAQEQWAEAFLRFKTGAAATKDEVALNVRTFFPQPGDSAAVVEQKRRARQQAARDISFAAGQKVPEPEQTQTGGWGIKRKE